MSAGDSYCIAQSCIHILSAARLHRERTFEALYIIQYPPPCAANMRTTMLLTDLLIDGCSVALFGKNTSSIHTCSADNDHVLVIVKWSFSFQNPVHDDESEYRDTNYQIKCCGEDRLLYINMCRASNNKKQVPA